MSVSMTRWPGAAARPAGRPRHAAGARARRQRAGHAPPSAPHGADRAGPAAARAAGQPLRRRDQHAHVAVLQRCKSTCSGLSSGFMGTNTPPAAGRRSWRRRFRSAFRGRCRRARPLQLDAMLRLWIKQSGLETGFLKPLDCYLDRSLRFAPDDPVPPLLFASYFAKLNRKTDALSLVDRALRSPKAWALTHFNAGLVLMELGEAQRALEQAHLAMAQGLNRPDLRDALMKAGAWREPTADKGSAATTPATAASAASES
jgi:tetratricopeptide (TPR) repeat protein